MLSLSRYRFATRAAGIHCICSVVVALLAAWIVFGIWYPYPYGELAGGQQLFLLVVSVDVVCGPLLTFVIFNPKKRRRELIADLGLVALIQVAALGYGLGSVWQARPIYLVHEVERFRVIAAPDIDVEQLNALPGNLKPEFWAGPKVVDIRSPKSIEERNTILFAAATGGRDYGARPDFYIPYDSVAGEAALRRAKPLTAFLEKQPLQQDTAKKLAINKGATVEQWFYLPVVGREDWVAILDKRGQIQGFLKGDGF